MTPLPTKMSHSAATSPVASGVGANAWRLTVMVPHWTPVKSCRPVDWGAMTPSASRSPRLKSGTVSESHRKYW